MANPVMYAIGSTTREPSESIWSDCPVAEILQHPGVGVHFYDNFVDLPLQPTLTTQIGYGKYKAYGTASCTIKGVDVVNSVELGGGYLEFAANANNDGLSIAQAYPTLMLSGNVSDSGKLWFEARIATSTIAVNTSGWFLGLAETEALTLSATVPFNAAYSSVSTAGSLIGFTHDEAVATGKISTAQADRASSFTAIGSNEATFNTTTNYTFTKLGMIYDPRRLTDCIRFFQDGVQLTTVVSRTTLQAYTYLDANALGMLFANVIDSAGAAVKNYMQWWRVAQLSPGEQFGN